MKAIEHYQGKDIAKELLDEKIADLENKPRTFIENEWLNALLQLRMEIRNVEMLLPLPF